MPLNKPSTNVALQIDCGCLRHPRSFTPPEIFHTIPTISVDELAGDLAMWSGVDNATDMELVLPNVSSFRSYSAVSPPLGLFS